MIQGNKQFMLKWVKNPALIKKIESYKSDDIELVCDVMTKKAYKSRKQNSLFHGLLGCFWDSGCSSFETPEELRNWYKEMAGLKVKEVKIVQIDYPQWLNPFISLIESMTGKEVPKLEVETTEVYFKSWSDVKKVDATRTIQCLMYDMDMAQVIGSSQGKKYESILESLGQWFDF